MSDALFKRTFAALALASVPHLAYAQAAEDPREARLRALEAQLSALQHEVQALRAESAEARVEAERAAQRAPVVTLANATPQIATRDGQFRAAVRGVFQFDSALYQQGDPPPGAVQDLSSGSNFRRARIGVEGTAFRDWNYNLTYDFGGAGAEEQGRVVAAWVEYAGWDPLGAAGVTRLRIGAFPPPAGLEDAFSSNDSIFLEKGAAFEMTRSLVGGDGRSAIALLVNGDNWFASAALTGAIATAAPVFDEQTGGLVRLALAPLNSEETTLHIGAHAGAIFQAADDSPGSASGVVRLRERPEVRVDGTRLVDTGELAADGLDFWALELGLRHGPLLITAEGVRIAADRIGAIQDAAFSGWYVQGAWALTGETRAWSAGSGGFGGLRPAHPFDPAAGHWGAWEAAARYSVLDLNDNETALGPAGPLSPIVRGGEQSIFSLGLNWQPNRAVRFLFDHQWVEIDRLDAAGLAQIGQDYRVFSARSQLAF